MTHRIERQDVRDRFAAGSDAFERREAVNLEIHRTVAIRNQVVFRLRRRRVHAIHGVREKIDGRSAEQPEVRGIDRVLEPGLHAIHREIQLQLFALAGAHSVCEAGHGEEQKPLGE